MKKRTVVIGVLLVSILGVWCWAKYRAYAYWASLPDAPDHPANIEPTRCPYGHTALKDVPIVYGTFKTETPQMQAAVEAHKVWLGGCLVGPETVKVVCVTCDFAYDGREMDFWSRTSPDRDSFQHEFSPLLLSFPLPARAPATQVPHYGQTLRAGKVFAENLSYSSSEAAETIASRIGAWLGQNARSVTLKKGTCDTHLWGKKDLYTWGEESGSPIHIFLEKFHNRDTCSVMLSVFRGVQEEIAEQSVAPLPRDPQTGHSDGGH